MKTVLGSLVLIAALSLGACKSAPDGPCEHGVVTTLYLGRSIPGGGTVDDAALARFLDEVAAPRFAGGFTVLRGEGWWREGGGTTTSHEDSVLLQVVHCETKAAEEALKAVAAAYAEQFQQQTVLRTDARAKLFW